MRSFAIATGSLIALIGCVLLVDSINPQQVAAAGIMAVLGFLVVRWGVKGEVF